MPTVDLEVEAGDWPPDVDWQAHASRAIEEAGRQAKVKLRAEAEVSVLLTDDARVAELNKDWRGLAKPTNVLSFQSVPVSGLANAPALGDIVLAYETILAEANAEAKPFKAHATHLVVHGFLHLIGYDHEESAEADAMEALEIAILAALGIADPYAGAEQAEAASI